MGRPREFDEAAALEAATQRFWRYGYEATSVRDLSEATGLTLASLYNAFGDKRSLYRRVLERYGEGAMGGFAQLQALDATPRERITAFLDLMVADSLADPDHKGCLIVNSALELSPHDPEFREVVAEVLTHIEAFFHRCVREGQAQGSISAAQPPEDLARTLLSVLLGLRVLARSRPERELLEGLVRPALALLAPSPPAPRQAAQR
ncbi:MAG: TetR/AcrR family transcriptional regulator [Caulobacteraceae bacterium]